MFNDSLKTYFAFCSFFSLKKEELRYRRISLFCSFIVLVTQFIYHLSDASWRIVMHSGKFNWMRQISPVCEKKRIIAICASFSFVLLQVARHHCGITMKTSSRYEERQRNFLIFLVYVYERHAERNGEKRGIVDVRVTVKCQATRSRAVNEWLGYLCKRQQARSLRLLLIAISAFVSALSFRDPS